ncbi:MAG: DUF1800 family protein [Acidobacteriota bacterium]|nr:DUF1800 family protein [Acidobacteriota bacterium]
MPMSASPDTTGDLKTALDTLFNHPNLPAFFCKQLIQHLVTNNPSPDLSAALPPSSKTTAPVYAET